MRVRALRPFTAYQPANCFFITAEAAGIEITDPAAAAYLLETHCAHVEPADDEAAALAARYVLPTVTADAQPVSIAVDGVVPVLVGEAGPELVVAGGVAVERAPVVEPTPYNATVTGPVEDRIPVERVGDDSAPDPAYDPADHTVDEVLEYVSAHPEQARAILALETAEDGKHRVTIVKALAD